MSWTRWTDPAKAKKNKRNKRPVRFSFNGPGTLGLSLFFSFFFFFFLFFFDIYNMEATCCWLLLALVPTVSKHLVIKSGKEVKANRRRRRRRGHNRLWAIAAGRFSLALQLWRKIVSKRVERDERDEDDG